MLVQIDTTPGWHVSDAGRLSWLRCSGSSLTSLGGRELVPPYDRTHYILPAGQPPRCPAARTLWEQFGDPLLNHLEVQLVAENPSLAAKYDLYVQARDAAAIARSDLYPQFNIERAPASADRASRSD